jgi:hypothetical protein
MILAGGNLSRRRRPRAFLGRETSVFHRIVHNFGNVVSRVRRMIGRAIGFDRCGNGGSFA